MMEARSAFGILGAVFQAGESTGSKSLGFRNLHDFNKQTTDQLVSAIMVAS